MVPEFRSRICWGMSSLIRSGISTALEVFQLLSGPAAASRALTVTRAEAPGPASAWACLFRGVSSLQSGRRLLWRCHHQPFLETGPGADLGGRGRRGMDFSTGGRTSAIELRSLWGRTSAAWWRRPASDAPGFGATEESCTLVSSRKLRRVTTVQHGPGLMGGEEPTGPFGLRPLCPIVEVGPANACAPDICLSLSMRLAFLPFGVPDHRRNPLSPWLKMAYKP